MSKIQKPILEKMLEPLGRCLTRETAEKLIALRADRALQKRVEKLATKNTAGTLTEKERIEYATYVNASNFIAILQNKARLVLAEDDGN